MTDSNLTLKVGTRRSELALKQTAIVVEALQKKFPQYHYEIVPLSTRGDEILDSALPLMGGKNLFTFELERELLENKIDMIVHSLKDVATEIQQNTCIGAVLKRDSRNDVVVISKRHTYRSLEELPSGSVVGTSSLRRVSLLKYLYPNLNRGNLNTRLSKLDNEEFGYDAIILAAAGMERLNFHDRISQYLPPNKWPYAVSQGIIAAQCRSNDLNVIRLLKSITHNETLVEAIIERSMMRTLKGGCSVPVGVDCSVSTENHPTVAVDVDNKITISIKGFIYSLQPGIPPLTSCHSCELTIDNNNCNTNDTINTIESIIINNKDSMQKVSDIGEKIAQQLLANNAIQYIESAKKSLAQMNF